MNSDNFLKSFGCDVFRYDSPSKNQPMLYIAYIPYTTEPGSTNSISL